MAELRTLGRPYARAVFQVANDSDSVSDWHQKLETLALASKDEKVALIINSVVHRLLIRLTFWLAWLMNNITLL